MAEKQPQYTSIPARSVRVGMFLFLRRLNKAYEVFRIEEFTLDQVKWYAFELETTDDNIFWPVTSEELVDVIVTSDGF